MFCELMGSSIVGRIGMWSIGLSGSGKCHVAIGGKRGGTNCHSGAPLRGFAFGRKCLNLIEYDGIELDSQERKISVVLSSISDKMV